MNTNGLSPTEFLNDIQKSEGLLKELVLDQERKEKFLPIHYYKSFTDNMGKTLFNIYFKNGDFPKILSVFKKWSKCEIVITELQWLQRSGEFIPVLGEKLFFKCQVVDIRKKSEFLQLLIL